MSAKQPLIVGVTGGIGSGKTTVIKAFEALGVPSYIADERAKEIMNEDKVLIQHIKDNFGEDTYENGQLHPARLANIVFKDKKALKLLNSLVHPAVRKDFNTWHKKQVSTVVVYESALIFEHAQEQSFDYIILVTAPIELRIERVVKRNKTTKEEVLKRINNQMPDEEKAKKSDFIIKNLNNSNYKKEINNIYAKINKKTQKIT